MAINVKVATGKRYYCFFLYAVYTLFCVLYEYGVLLFDIPYIWVCICISVIVILWIKQLLCNVSRHAAKQKSKTKPKMFVRGVEIRFVINLPNILIDRYKIPNRAVIIWSVLETFPLWIVVHETPAYQLRRSAAFPVVPFCSWHAFRLNCRASGTSTPYGSDYSNNATTSVNRLCIWCARRCPITRLQVRNERAFARGCDSGLELLNFNIRFAFIKQTPCGLRNAMHVLMSRGTHVCPSLGATHMKHVFFPCFPVPFRRLFMRGAVFVCLTQRELDHYKSQVTSWTLQVANGQRHVPIC